MIMNPSPISEQVNRTEFKTQMAISKGNQEVKDKFGNVWSLTDYQHIKHLLEVVNICVTQSIRRMYYGPLSSYQLNHLQGTLTTKLSEAPRG